MPLLGATDFPLWGERDYVQSSHLVEAFLGCWAASGRAPLDRVQADFRSFVRNNGEFMLLDDPREMDTPLLLRAHAAGGVTSVGLAPNGDPVTRRLPDDEAELVAGARISPDERSGELDASDPRRLLGAMVALVKLVHNAGLPSQGYGRWYVAGADLDMAVMRDAGGSPMAARIEREVGGRMTRSVILLGGTRAAHLSFIREAS